MNRSRSHNPRRAFSLVELMLVAVLIGIIGTVVVPGIMDTGASNLPAAARMLAADLGYAQGLALSEASPVAVRFDTAGDRYGVYRVANDGTASLVEHPVRHGEGFEVRLAGSGPFSQVALAVANFEGHAAVRFGSLGEPDHPGAVELRQQGQRIWVLVRPATGVVKVTRDFGDVADLGI